MKKTYQSPDYKKVQIPEGSILTGFFLGLVSAMNPLTKSNPLNDASSPKRPGV